jgi:cbb3-type cytochrome oxidase subunit 3
MKISDYVSSLDIATFPEIGMVIFFAVFCAVVWRTYGRGGKRRLEGHGSIALDDGETRPIRPSDGGHL